MATNEFIQLSCKNLWLLRQFLDNAGQSLEWFRYFKKRKFECLNNHIVTYILTEDSKPVGYGHLDRDENKVWLGVCIVESKVNHGYGKKMLEKLLLFAKNNNIGKLYLSVDKDNHSAIHLYEKYNFKLCDTKEFYVYEWENI